ncbi:MAG: hypothetical protein AUJ55_01900 [Proteobacteria bacterium CG1_02_64_396]|nr:MAG: hypothetical protein AUJ55_01900 [Proteobacteria bacterium CG1_02_64_396]
MGHPKSSSVIGFIQRGIRTTLVEPDPFAIALIRSAFGGMDHVTLHTCALCDEAGAVELCQRAGSTFVATLEATPALVNDRAHLEQPELFTAEAKRFDAIDDGGIDLLSIDIEGGEWFVLKHMVSRPAVVSVETHGGIYINPYLAEIRGWMVENRYVLWYLDGSDSVFVREGTVALSLWDRMALIWTRGYLVARFWKKKVNRGFKGLFGVRTWPELFKPKSQ